MKEGAALRSPLPHQTAVSNGSSEASNSMQFLVRGQSAQETPCRNWLAEVCLGQCERNYQAWKTQADTVVAKEENKSLPSSRAESPELETSPA